MGKAAAPRALPQNEAKAVARMLRVSPQKLNLVAQMIRQFGVPVDALAQALDDPPTQLGILRPHRIAGGASDRKPGLAGEDDGLPRDRRRDLRLRSQNLHLIAVVQLRHQRRDLAVDLAADRLVADVGRPQAAGGEAAEVATGLDDDHGLADDDRIAREADGLLRVHGN